MLRIKQGKNGFYYSVWSNPVSRVLKAKCLLKNMEAIGNGVVLDYGSGDGPYRPFLELKFDQYLAADYKVTNLHHTGRPDVYIDDKQGLNQPDNTFDCVVLTEVLEHIYKPHEALKEIRRVLKADGYLAGTVPFFMWEHEAPYDFHRYTYYALKRMFEEQGFEIIRLDYVGDTVGALAYLHSKVFGTFIKPFRRIPVLRNLLSFLARLPELSYYVLTRAGFIEKLFTKYFGQYPFGFVFILKKAEPSTSPG
jgi:SAM-dependent methyltransferase